MDTVVIKKEPEVAKNTYQICRLCLSEDSLDDVFKEEELHQWIAEYLSITISSGDSMSQEVQDVLQSLDQNDNSEANSELLTNKMLPRYGCTHCGKMFVLRYHLDQHAVTHTKVIRENQLKTVIREKQHVDSPEETRERNTDIVNLAKDRANGTSNHENREPQEISASLVSKKPKKNQVQKVREKRSPKRVHPKEPTTVRTTVLEDMIDIEDIKIEPHGDDDDDGCSNISVDQPSSLPLDIDNDNSQDMQVAPIDVSQIVLEKPVLYRDKTVPCPLCHKKFRTKLLLWNHNRTTHGPKVHKCKVCKARFAMPNELEKHNTTSKHKTNLQKFLDKQQSIKRRQRQRDETEILTKQIIVNNEEEYSCPTCNQVFKRQCQFKAHMLEHTSKVEHVQLSDLDDSEPEVVVSEQSAKTASVEQPPETQETVVDLPWKCSHCHRAYTDEAKLKNHQRFHKPKNFKCPICERPFLRQGLVDKHIPVHNEVRTWPITPSKEKSQERPYKCDICQKTYMSQTALCGHKKQVHGPRIHECHICKFSFSLRKKLEQHNATKRHLTNMQKFLEKQKSYELRQSQKGETEILVKQIIANNEEEYSCPTCNKVFKRQCKFKTHMLEHTSKLEDEQLSELEDSEPEEVVPEQSTKTANVEQPPEPKEAVVDKPWKCSKCHRAYTHKAKLKNHQRFHRPKKFKCPICEKPFLRQGLVDIHVPVHNAVRSWTAVPPNDKNQEKPFKCDICHKAYTTNPALCGHKKQVHGPKIHVCHICKFSFSIRKDLRRHIKTHY